MARHWTLALMVLVWASANVVGSGGDKADKGKDNEFKVEGTLSKKDPQDKKLASPSQVHKYKMEAGTTYTLRMASTEVDAYLRLEDSTGKQLAENDDEEPYKSFNAKIVFKCEKDGEYKIICAAFPGPIDKKFKQVGKYTLTITKTGQDKAKITPAQAGMYGKPAPEVIGDFSINGKTMKLSELKGKVVLLDFWAIWCTPCVATFPHLRDWSRDHQKQGLEVLGVTTYHETFGFDKKTGKFTTVSDKLKPAAEQIVLKDFADFHKLTFQQLVVPKGAWEKAQKDYHFLGIPTIALIDRKGHVRMVAEGLQEENARAMHDEIKKVLAEK